MLKKGSLCKILIIFMLLYSCAPENSEVGTEQVQTDLLLKNLSLGKSTMKTEKSVISNIDSVLRVVQITGKTEKGPFRVNSKITITQLDDSLEKTDKVFHTKTLDNQGSYFYEGKFKTLTPILVEVEGKYFDEVQNKISDKTLKLKTIGRIGLSSNLTVNVNGPSSLQTKRLTELVKTGSTFSEAEEISRKEVLNVFGVDSSRVKKKLSEISLKESPDLLRISVILQGKEGNPKILLDTIEKEIGENGKVVDKKTIATLQKNEKEADYKKVVANLKSSLSIKSNANPISLKKMKVDPAGGASVAKKTDKTPSNPRSDLEKINTFTVADIKGWDGITPDSSALPSSVSNPSFTLPSAHNGINSFLVTVSSVVKNDTTGIYQYTARVSNQANSVSKNFNIVYNTGFATISALLNTFTTADIKGWDGITINNRVLPSSVANPNFTLPSAHNGISNFRITASSVSKNDTTGIYQYTARVSNQANSVSKNFNVVYNTGFATISALLNTFTTADIKGWDGLTPDSRVLPSSVSNPSFTLPSAHNGISSFRITASSVVKNDVRGTYQYTARVSNQANSVSKNFSIVYNTGFATVSSLLNTFTTADIKGWDGVNLSASILPSSVANPNFTLPSAHNGISSFRVTASSVSKNDVRGTYQYTARISNQANSVSKNLNVVYSSGFATISSIFNTFTTADIKQWDGITPDSTVLPSSVSNPNFTTLPSQYKGITGFQIELDASSIKKTDALGEVEYDVILKDRNNQVRKAFTITYNTFFATTFPVITFKSIQDSSSKTYGRSPLSVVPVNSATTILSHATRTTCSTTENTILISSDNWTNCEAVYVKKGPNNNFVLIPKETWALNTTYKVGVRGNTSPSAVHSSVVQLKQGQSFVSFETNNSNGGGDAGSDTGSLDLGSSMASDFHTYGNKIYLRDDGYSFIFYTFRGHLPTKLAYHADSNNICSSYINYDTSGTGGLKMTTIVGANGNDRKVLLRALQADGQDANTYYFKYPPASRFANVSWLSSANITLGWHSPFTIVQFCVYRVADRS